MQKVLITGGAGFIGSNLAINLIKNGHKVTVLDNLSPQIHGNDPEKTSPLYLSIKDHVDFIQGSVTIRKDWEKALKGQDAVIHLAAETGTGQSMYEIDRYVDVNIRGTAIFLDYLTNHDHSIKKIIVASSRSIYGEGKYLCENHGVVFPNDRKDEDLSAGKFDCLCSICSKELKLLPTSEDSKIHPSSIYGITKQNQEQMFLTVGKSLNIPAVALRYQNVYGPGQSLSNPYTGILSIFSTQIKNGNSINIFEDGKESRDFVFIDDVVDATRLALEKSNADFMALNVGADEPINVLTVAKELKANYKSDVEINITGNYRLGDIRHNYADLAMINKLLDYSPKVSFQEGIKRFCFWVNKQAIQEDKYQESIRELKEKGLYK